MGEMGPDQGRGGKHLIVPPGQERARRSTTAYYVQRATGMNIMFGFRTLDPDPGRRRRWSTRCGSTHIAEREDPPPTRIDLARTAARGPATSRAASTTGCGCTTSTSPRSSTSATASTWRCCKQLGIEKGQPFAPDERLTRDPGQDAPRPAS